MPHPLADKTATLLIVEPQQARRSMLTEGFKRLGISRVQSCVNLKDAFSFVEGETTPPDWIITPLFEEMSTNAFHLLQMLIDNERLRGIRVSLVIEPEQAFCLRTAFARGLFSWHARFPDTASQMAAITDVLATGEECGWDDCLISAHYLRGHLKDENRFEDLERLEKRLLSLYPDQQAVVLKLAEALFLGGKMRQAQMVLDRVQGLTGDLEMQASVLADQVATALGGDDQKVAAKALHINRAVVIDPDEAARNHARDALRDIGVEAIDDFADGETAWQHMKTKEGAPDLIVMEWRLPKLGADVLVQRARLNGLAGVPIIIFSSLVKNQDRMLLREMGVTDVIQKPMSVQRLAGAIVSIMREERRPKTVEALERQARAAIAQRDLAGARKFLQSFPAGEKDADVRRRVLEAEIAFQMDELQRANELATQALVVGGEDVMVLNLLGKIQMKLGQHAQAVRFFDQAQKLSPQNIGRLLYLAEAHVGADQQGNADQTLEKAKKLDAGNPRVAEAEAKVALAGGDAERAKDVMARVGSTPGIVAFVNNRAVSLVNQSRVLESVELYRTALKSLPKKAAQARPIVSYNLALALLRLGDTVGADKVLKDTEGGRDRALAAKIQSLAARTAKAVATGEAVQLHLEPAVVPGSGESSGTVEAQKGPSAPDVSVRLGAMRCYLVFEDEFPDPKTLKLVPTKTVAHKARKAIQKGQPDDPKVKRTG